MEAGSETDRRIAAELARSGVRMVASLPDDWVSGLIRTLDADARFAHVPVSREESAVGLCSGAFLAGLRSVAVMGASGLTTCIYAITKVSFTYQFPLVVFATLRGSIGDPRPHHVSNGLYLSALIDTLGLFHLVVDEPAKIASIPAAIEHAYVMNRPVVVGFSRAVLKGATA